MNSHLFIFFTQILVVFISGISQGTLLPLLSVLLEEQGVSASLNGLNASMLYIGILVAAPIAEKILYRVGYKPMLVYGMIPTVLIILSFPLFTGYFVWMIFRFAMGILGNMIYYASIVWLTDIAPNKKRGVYISACGFAFGSGFALGPQMMELRQFSDAMPFIFAAILIRIILGRELGNRASQLVRIIPPKLCIEYLQQSARCIR